MSPSPGSHRRGAPDLLSCSIGDPGDVEVSCHHLQMAIDGPEREAVQQGRGEEMGIDPPDAAPPEGHALDEVEDFTVLRDTGRRELGEAVEHVGACGDGTEGELAEHERMYADVALFEEAGETRVTAPPVIEPDRGVDEDDHRLRR